MGGIALVIVGLLAGGVGVLLGRYVFPKSSSEREINIARREERERGLNGQIDELRNELAVRTKERNDAAQATSKSEQEKAALNERINGLMAQIEVLKSQQTTLHDSLKAELENLATRALKANAADLANSSQQQLNNILEPFKERIRDFQGKIEATYDAEKRDVLALKEQIRMVVETGQSLGAQAESLAKALKGDIQQLGRWGELVLDRILQAAGLVEGREYVSQGRGLGLKNDAGGAQKPDVVLLLPDKRTMVIDSKVSLASYDRLITCVSEDERQFHASQFVRDMRAHIDGLAAKRYQDNEQLGAHDCVLMFVPIEGALAAALTAEPEMFLYAWDKKVVLVGPPTLLMTLRTIGSIWRYENQAQNAQTIARLAGILCDKITDSLSDLNVVTDKLGDAMTAHNEALKRMATGKGNAISVGERLKVLGAKANKPLPPILVDGEPIGVEPATLEEIEK